MNGKCFDDLGFEFQLYNNTFLFGTEETLPIVTRTFSFLMTDDVLQSLKRKNQSYGKIHEEKLFPWK